MFDIPKYQNNPVGYKYNAVAQFENDFIKINQYEYPNELYKLELQQHDKSLKEYDLEIYQTFLESLEMNKPNIELYKQQPYLTFSIRLKLIDFLLKMSIRLKILPFVFYKAVKIFDRYCSKRIVLLDQSQLIITTCLWIASKLQGGNNHFINLNNLDKVNSIKSINDLGYGSGGKFKGPTERFRLPKLHELVKLCGAKCKYDQGMFKQMELHVLSTLDWNFNDPSIEEFLIQSNDFNLIKENEFFKIKEFLSYISLYSYELIDISIIELSKVIIDLINETLNLDYNDHFHQKINYALLNEKNFKIDQNKYNFIKKNLIKSILNSSEFILKLFNSRGPQQFFYSILSIYKFPNQSKLNTPPSSNTSYNFQSPTSTPSNQGVAGVVVSNHQTHHLPTVSPQPIFKPVVLQNLLKFSPSVDLPSNASINYNNQQQFIHPHYSYANKFNIQNNTSQTSLNSSISSVKDHDYNLIFEYDPRKLGISTPLSDEESPMLPLVKPVQNVHSH